MREAHAHAHLPGRPHLQREILEVDELRVLLDDRHDILAEALPGQHQRQHGPILDAIADQQRIAVDLRQRGDELGLRAALESHAVWAARVEQLVHDLVKLVHFDRIDAAVDVLVPGFLDRGAKSFVQALHLGTQDILETDQDRQLHAAPAQLLDDEHDVHRGRRLAQRTHGDVARTVHEEVRIAPARRPIELGGVLCRPRFCNRQRLGNRLRGHLQSPRM